MKALIGKNIASARNAQGWTQRQLAEAAGIRDDQQVSKWERGVYKPEGHALIALAAALKKELAWFYIDHDAAAAAAA